MKKPKTARLVWGIILAAIGLFGLSGTATADNKTGFIITCILFMIAGGLLIFFYVRSMGRYRACIAADAALRQKLQQENEKRIREAQEAREQKREEEARRKWEEENALHTCPNCGASVKGHFCDYCGSKF